MAIAASAGKTSPHPSKRAPLSSECHLFQWFIHWDMQKYTGSSLVKLNYWAPNTTASATTLCPGAAGELRLNLVIHKHKYTHAPTIQSPSPHMGLKTIGLAPALPSLLPLAAYSTWKCFYGVTMWDNNSRANDIEPMSNARFQKGTELEWEEIDSSHIKEPPSPCRKMAGRSSSFSTWLNHTLCLKVNPEKPTRSKRSSAEIKAALDVVSISPGPSNMGSNAE